MFDDFKQFIMRGNVIDLAVGIVLGIAFNNIVNSLVDDIIMPPVGLYLAGADFSDLFVVLQQGTPPGPYETLAAAQAAGAVTISYGIFINTIVNFLILAFAMFLLIRNVNRLHGKEEAAPDEPITRECPYCLSTIPTAATRCPHCTSQVEPVPAAE